MERIPTGPSLGIPRGAGVSNCSCRKTALGALNLYNEKRDAFGERLQAFGMALAAHAAPARSAANAQDESENLQKALESSREIGTAIGILMCQMKVDQHGAFASDHSGRT